MGKSSVNPTEGFTWEWIIESLEQIIQHLTQSIQHNLERSHQSQELLRRSYEALLLAIPQLHEHPELANNVPMKSLAALRWFPQKAYEVQLFYDPLELHYEITIIKRDIADSFAPRTHIEETHVHLNNLADSVAVYIEKAKQLPTN